MASKTMTRSILQLTACVYCYVVFSLSILLSWSNCWWQRWNVKKLFPSAGKICSSTLIRQEDLGTSSASATKTMAENFTLFAIEEKIAVQMLKNITRRAKIQLDEWQLLFEEYLVDYLSLKYKVNRRLNNFHTGTYNSDRSFLA